MSSDAPSSLAEVTGGFREGDILAGKYRIDRVLGAGGMGVVVAAHHVYLDEKVAIKFLNQDVLGNSEVVARFAQEARAAVKIKNDHVVRVIDVGTLDTGAPYMVMEYLEGGDLSAWLETRGALAMELAIDFVLQSCEALADAHRLGIVHRDLKPSNLFWVRRSDNRYHIKVLDFGISKALSWSTSQRDLGMTKTNSIIGSPLYMSPEQMQSAKTVDIRTDIWSLGVILYELLVRQPPFGGETLTEVCSRVVTQPAPAICQQRTDVPADLEQVIHKCLEKDRENRYANVAELALALAPFSSRKSRPAIERICAIVLGSAASDVSASLAASFERPGPILTADTMSPPLSQTAPSTRRSRAIPLTVALTLLVAALLIGSMVLRSRGPVPAVSAQASMLPEATSLQVPTALRAAAAEESQNRAATPLLSSSPEALASAMSTVGDMKKPRPSGRLRTADVKSSAPTVIADARPTPLEMPSAHAAGVPAPIPSTNRASATAATSPTNKWGGRL